MAAPRRSLCLVDDHAVLREHLTQLLDQAGYDIVAAVGSCAEGYEAVIAHVPFAAVIDNHLPDGWGTDLCRRLSVAVPGVRLIVHTGMLAPGLDEVARDAGAWAVVAKSVRGTDLLATLESAGTGGDAAP
jgi:DNA-binding NarL/FixJ family response regulator